LNGVTEITQQGAEQLGVMVRSSTSIHVYWETTDRTTLGLHVTDLSGRPREDSLDGTGHRMIRLLTGTGSLYLEKMIPGHIYHFELGEMTDRGFSPLISSRPVETPWASTHDESAFPKPYHRS